MTWMKKGKHTNAAAASVFCLIAAALMLALASRNSPFYPLNTYADANCFFTVGKSMMNGVVPYRDLYEQKGPLLYFLYGLAYLLSPRSFHGVYLLELLAVWTSMLGIRRIVGLFSDRPFLGVEVLLTALMLSAHSYGSGGNSVEEYCIPMFIWSMYALLRVNALADVRPVCFVRNGVFAGAVLLMKYNLTAFYMVWLPFALYGVWKNRGARRAWRMLAAFAAGAMLCVVPFVLYFLWNHALSDFIRVYFLDNMNGYTVTEESVLATGLAVVGNILRAGLKNMIYTVPAAAGLIWLLLSKQAPVRTKVGIFALLLAATAAAFGGGRAYAYYMLYLWSFISFFAVPVQKALEKVSGQWLRYAVPAGALAAGLAMIALLCSNVYFFGSSKSDFPQFAFAEEIRESEDPTLLNYGFMDGGFYTASGVVPNTKYFTTLNIYPAYIMEQQNRYVEQGLVSYVVTQDVPLGEAYLVQYRLIDRQVFHSKSFSSTFYLYRRIE